MVGAQVQDLLGEEESRSGMSGVSLYPIFLQKSWKWKTPGAMCAGECMDNLVYMSEMVGAQNLPVSHKCVYREPQKPDLPDSPKPSKL